MIVSLTPSKIGHFMNLKYFIKSLLIYDRTILFTVSMLPNIAKAANLIDSFVD
jgi:hypothetical protein